MQVSGRRNIPEDGAEVRSEPGLGRLRTIGEAIVAGEEEERS